MARMPPGQPRTVPDPAGELYDQEMAKVRAPTKSPGGAVTTSTGPVRVATVLGPGERLRVSVAFGLRRNAYGL
jgi:hypothetical protein